MTLEQVHHGEGGPGGNEGLSLLPHVTAVLHGLDDRGPRGRTTDAQFLELLHDAGLGVARRGSGLVAVGVDRLHRHDVAHLQRRQQRLGIVGVGGVLLAGFLVRLAMAGEGDGRSAGRELAVVGGIARRGHGDGAETNGHGHAGGIDHLRRQGALPHQSVQSQIGATQLTGHRFRRPQGQRGADGLVRLLGVLHLVGVPTSGGGQVIRAEFTANLAPHGVERFVGQGDRVGSHISNESPLVQTLGRSHDLLGRHAQFASTLLLQGAGHERSLGRRSIGLVLDRAHGDGGVGQAGDQAVGGGFAQHHDTVLHPAGAVEIFAGGHPTTVELQQGGLERGRRGRHQVEAPVARGHEGDAFAFAFHDETHGGALHATGRQSSVHFPPQHG